MHSSSRKRFAWAITALLIVSASLITYADWGKPSYAYMPPASSVVNPPDTEEGVSMSAQNQDASDPAMIEFGREAFYKQTFGNEVFFSDIMGLYDGAFTMANLTKALVRLGGRGTTNLQVEAAKTVTVGDRTIRQGEFIDTGLDVAKGAYVPIGVKLTYDEGRPKAGISCIMCHAISEPSTGKVIEGVPNPDVNVGLLLALATNSAAFFTHTGVTSEQLDGLVEYIREEEDRVALPDPDRLEQIVDEAFVKWPPGYVDTMIDLVNAPVQIPDSFTRDDHPYGWSGFAGVGPFRGLAFLNGIPNAQNMDPLSQSPLSEKLFKIDEERYIGTILQRASNPKYRYDPASGEKPSAFFKRIDPTPGMDGVNMLVRSPTFPKLSQMSFIAHIASVPGYPVGRHLLGLAAYQNALSPPATGLSVTTDERELGEQTFRKANCIQCHALPDTTNHRIVPIEIIGTNPARAKALQKTEPLFGPNVMYQWDTPVPLPDRPRTYVVPEEPMERSQIELSLAHGGTKGGYKVPSLVGLYWSAPYLHDGGVAVGADAASQLGIPGTLYKGIPADPKESLRGLVDRKLRERVVQANHDNEGLRSMNIEGVGHTYWVDEEAGFTKEEQEALIRYVLTVGEHETDRKAANAKGSGEE
ncbi:electron transport protein [Paenibacillus sp. TRM 82003]|nr:electron transport protein [Paenibacillus sp. TRM 82003]